jgi:hypothetical protein
VNPRDGLGLSGDEVVSCFEKVDHLVLDDVLNGLLDIVLGEDFVDLVLDSSTLRHFNGHVDLLHEILESLDLLWSRVLVPSQQRLSLELLHEDFSDLLVGEDHQLLYQEVSLLSLVDLE